MKRFPSSLLKLIFNHEFKFEKTAAVVVIFGSALLREKIHNGSEGLIIRNYTSSRYFRVNYSRTILVSIVKIFFWLLSPFFQPISADMVRQMKARPKPTTRSLFCQPELDEESETEFQRSDFDFPSTHAVQNVMQEVLRFSELSSREQLSHIEMDPLQRSRILPFSRWNSIFGIGSGFFANPIGWSWIASVIFVIFGGISID